MTTPKGSPPHMRGKATAETVRDKCKGITPAYAGKSGINQFWYSRVEDHPRVCGEKLFMVVTDIAPVGSPPRMRGKGSAYMLIVFGCGITPAYAGKRPARSTPTSTRRDHPRVCGEKGVPPGSTAPALGSPPRMRGKVSHDLLPLLPPGITPAYAGKSMPTSPRRPGS